MRSPLPRERLWAEPLPRSSRRLCVAIGKLYHAFLLFCGGNPAQVNEVVPWALTPYMAELVDPELPRASRQPGESLAEFVRRTNARMHNATTA